MNYRNNIYLKSEKILQIESNGNVAEQLQDVSDWTEGTYSLINNEDTIVIPFSEIAYVHTEKMEGK